MFCDGLGPKGKMQVYINNVRRPRFPGGCAFTIGNFDGVHLGHRRVLSLLRERADALGLPAVAMIFEPQPQEFFAKRRGAPMPFRLTPARDKIALLRATGCLDAVWGVRFGEGFASAPAEEFVENVLVRDLGVKFLMVGDDFRFGKNRGGDFALLAANPAFETMRTPSLLFDNIRASSTAVREALFEGRVEDANAILGHDYCLTGRVARGKGMGGPVFGCPTANVALFPHRYALRGVFAIEASIEGELDGQGQPILRDGVASFGVNPTVERQETQKLEAHLFDYSGDLLGRRLTVRFKSKLRDEEKFDGFDALKAQIARDAQAARAVLRALRGDPAPSPAKLGKPA